MGIVVEPPEFALTNYKSYALPLEFICGPSGFEQYSYHSSGLQTRNTSDDEDTVIYSLRKYVRLAMVGNPTILTTLFTPDDMVIAKNDVLWNELKTLTPLFISAKVKSAFKGYMSQQISLMLNQGQGRAKRPELIAKYNFDTKFAYHIVRLGYQGIELLTTGKITLPMPEKERKVCLDIRQGIYTQEQVLELARELETQILAIEGLPEEPETEEIEKFVLSAYKRIWAW